MCTHEAWVARGAVRLGSVRVHGFVLEAEPVLRGCIIGWYTPISRSGYTRRMGGSLVCSAGLALVRLCICHTKWPPLNSLPGRSGVYLGHALG